MPPLVKIFNYIYDKGIYPKSWCKGVIVPVFKKGDRSNAANYRGTTLVNVIAKLFSTALQNRLNNWCEKENAKNASQFVFMDNNYHIYFFILCINDKKDCLNFQNFTENDLRILSVFILLFADDLALFYKGS